jgi:hypothetical protein
MTIAENWKRPLVIAGVCVALVAVGVGLWLLERYLHTVRQAGWGPLALEDPPAWVEESLPLQEKVVAAAGSAYLPLQEDVARALAANLSAVAWLADVQVRVTPTDVRIRAYWRRPVAMLEMGTMRFYVDQDLVVLDYVDLPHLGIKRVTGVQWPQVPSLGEVLNGDDLKEAIDVLALLECMDVRTTPGRPLLSEIESIDVSNFQGRKNAKDPHVVLFAKDGITQINWGAEIGTWAKHLEARDEQKLGRLYSYYKVYGTLMGEAKYIELREPLGEVPSPIDQYPQTSH